MDPRLDRQGNNLSSPISSDVKREMVIKHFILVMQTQKSVYKKAKTI